MNFVRETTILVERFESRFFKILKLKSIEKFEFHRSSDGFSLSLKLGFELIYLFRPQRDGCWGHVAYQSHGLFQHPACYNLKKTRDNCINVIMYTRVNHLITRKTTPCTGTVLEAQVVKTFSQDLSFFGRETNMRGFYRKICLFRAQIYRVNGQDDI